MDGEELRSFLSSLYGDGIGYVALASQAPGGKWTEGPFFRWPDNIDKAIEKVNRLAVRRNVWQSVHLFSSPRRKEELIERVRVLYTDDRADFGAAPASIVVRTSPGKVQGYWLLREAIPFDRARGLQARLVVHVGGDPGAKDMARVLRSPGTVNRKKEYADNPPAVEIIAFDPTCLYNADELDRLLPKLPESDARTKMTTAEIAALHVVRQTGEGRWEALRTIAGHEIATTRKPVDEVIEYVQTFNVAYCEPAYPQEEIVRLVRDLATKEKDKPRPTLLTPVVINLADVKPEAIDWLARPHLAVRKINFIFGHPDSGKTYVALDLAARVTTGRAPFAVSDSLWRAYPRRVLYMTAEDSLSDTIRPRMDKLGGDAARFHSFTLAMDGNREKFVNIDEDLEVLARVLDDIQPRLFVLDPLNAFVGRKVDIYRSNQVRDIMRRLGHLIGQTDTCAVVIAHPSKGDRDTVLNRMADSAVFGQAARSVLLAGADPDEKGQFVLSHEKRNLSG